MWNTNLSGQWFLLTTEEAEIWKLRMVAHLEPKQSFWEDDCEARDKRSWEH